jgi:hypothetical protein
MEIIISVIILASFALILSVLDLVFAYIFIKQNAESFNKEGIS